MNLTVAPADRVGVVGPNGSGKSTLLRLMAGDLDPDMGKVRASGTVVLLPQVIDWGLDLAAIDWLLERTGVAATQRRFEAAATALADGEADAADRYDQALAALVAADPSGFEARARAVAEDLSLGAVSLGQSVGSLSGGQRTRLKLAAIQLSAADVLLLDEPTNDLDHQGLAQLEQALSSRQGPTVVVSHDRSFVEGFVNVVVELDDHTHELTRFDGGYRAWIDERAAARRRAESDFQEWTQQRAELKQRAARQRQWSRHGEASVRKGDEPDRNIRMARIERAQKLGSRAATTGRALERHDRSRVAKPWDRWELRLEFAEAGRSGDVVAELAAAVVERGAFRMGPLELTLHEGDRVLVQGPNGGGKSSLVGALFGTVGLSSGVSRLGRSTKLGTMTQDRRMFGSGPLVDSFVAHTGMPIAEARSQLAKLGIDSARSERDPATLSPGEVTRATLGCFAAVGVNTLVLDEPTNHLDLEAIEQLEAALGRFGGTVVLITHDRHLASAFEATRTWNVKDGVVTECV
ncbi:MAG: ATP-binding cassette domain-containing protein [Acidimicrobiales bacterium]